MLPLDFERSDVKVISGIKGLYIATETGLSQEIESVKMYLTVK